MINFFKNNFILFVIVVLSVLIRFCNLSKVPSALYYDEIDLGYQIRSYLETGKDYRNTLSPFYAKSLNTDKTPLPIWFSLPFTLVSSTPEFQVRAGTAVAGVFVVLLGMGISWLLFANRATTIITGIVLTFSPWLVHFSRLAFEAQFALMFSFLFLYFFLLWNCYKTFKYLLFSFFALGLSVYTYRTMSLLAPLFGFCTLIIFRREFLSLGIKKNLTLATIFLFLYLPFLYSTTVGSKDQTRISQISIFSDPKIAIEIQRSRELVSGNFQDSTPGQKASLQSKVFHNKLLSFFDRLTSNSLNNFSPDFLFFKGDGNGRHSSKNSGELLLIDVVGLVLGMYYLFKQIKSKNVQLLIALLFLGALPANLTLDGANHASRLITFAGPLLLIVSFGYSKLFQLMKSTGKLYYVFLVATLALWVFCLGRFMSNYFFQFPVLNAREFGYGYKQAILKIEDLKQNYNKIYLSGVNDPPMLYYFFWAKIRPREVQNYGTEYGDNILRNQLLDHVKPFYPTDLLCKEKEIEKLDEKTLYMVDYRSLPLDFRNKDKDPVPVGIKLLDIIKYPDNEVAYYLITRDIKNGKPIAPTKGQSCK